MDDFAADSGSTASVLAIGAHPDDIELGCGGALLAHRRRGDRVAMLVMTTGEQGSVDAKSRVSEQEDAAELLGAQVFWGGFQDGAVPDGRAAVEVIEGVLRSTGATVLYTHSANDTHQDHRATAVASQAAARRLQHVFHYEAPTTTTFNPSVYVDIDGLVEAKLDLIRAHLSQVLKNGLVDLAAVEAQARYRGFGARARNTEAFELDRMLWSLESGSAATDGAANLVAAERFR
jgi:LmbE family N-acetylglucosaminyl deacetylase